MSFDSDRTDPKELGITKVPRHVAVIMDGNGRWARQRGWIRLRGHREGAKAVKRTLEESYRLGVEYLTLFAFSTQNWDRPSTEVEGLMGLLLEYLHSERRELLRRGIRFRAIGDLSRLPQNLQNEIAALSEMSKDNDEMHLVVALSYGARDEIVRATRALAAAAVAGEIKPEDIGEADVSARLYTADMPDPDLLIRTSGELRVSNFMLWQLAYAELFVTDVFWPDFAKDNLIEALQAYSKRERRFGLTGAQVKK